MDVKVKSRKKVFTQRRNGATEDAKETTGFFVFPVATLRRCVKNLPAFLVCIIPTFAAWNCVRAIHVDFDGAPTPVARVV